MYSLPINVTFAAFTIASAASTAPMRPRVSTRPSASLPAFAIFRGTLAELREMRQLNYHPPRIAVYRRCDPNIRNLPPAVGIHPGRRVFRSGVDIVPARPRAGAAGRHADGHHQP